MVSRIRTSLWLLCFLVWTGLVSGCEWDKSTDQDLAPSYLKLASFLDQNLVRPVLDLDPESCRTACCNDTACDLVLVDGSNHCQLVQCMFGDRNLCELTPRTEPGHKVHVKETSASRVRARDTWNGLSPLMVPVPKFPEPESPVPESPVPESPEPLISEENSVLCRLPKKVGPCKAAFPRFYYDPTDQSCHSFIFGGCGTNRNMFETQQECEETCRGVTGPVLPDESTAAPPSPPDQSTHLVPALNTSDVKLDASQRAGSSVDDYEETCGAEPKVGHCRAAFPRWYYNRETGSCKRFIYGGCGGNKNNYHNEESCMAACRGVVLPSSQKRPHDDGASSHTDMCTVTPDPGPCRAAFPMFYYDPATSTCRTFTYGGCRGNKNRYSSEEECVSRCSGQGQAEGRGRARNRWTAGVFLFVTLASISALLLGSLIVITLRRNRLTRQASITSDKEELLHDDSSSLESLSVPQSPEPTQA